MSHSCQESVFKSLLRSLLKTFGVVIGLALAIMVVSIGLSFTEESIKKPEKGELFVAADAKRNRKILHDSSPVLLKLNIKGVIGEKKLTTDVIENLLLGIGEGELNKERIKGLLLAINTPGGLSTDSAGIFQAIEHFKKHYKIPVYAYVDGLCASGGMYIAAVADKIYATNDSIVGSIGARMGPFFNVATGMEKVGISSITIADGKDKDMLNPFRPWTEDEGASIRELVKADYIRFVDHMSSARPMLDKEKLLNEYGANVYDAIQGKEYGYVDIAGATYRQTIGDLAQAARIDENTNYQVLEIRAKESFFKEALENSFLLKGRVVHSLETGSHLRPEMSGKLLYLYAGSS